MTRSALNLLVLLLVPALGVAQPTVNVGSKRFTESYILAEIMARTVEAAGEARARHHQGLGNTAILFSALKSGAIHLYPEYTGTIALELLGLQRVPELVTRDERQRRIQIASHPGIEWRPQHHAIDRKAVSLADARPDLRLQPREVRHDHVGRLVA